MKRTRDSLKKDDDDGKKKTHVVIYYPEEYRGGKYSVSVVSLPIDCLMHPETNTRKNTSALDKVCKNLPSTNFLNASNSVCVTGDEGPRIYVFGGFCPKRRVLVNQVHRYDIHTGRGGNCTRMPNLMYWALVAQVGKDSLYFLSLDDKPASIFYPKPEIVATPPPRLIVNKYNLKTGHWKLVSGGDSVINQFDSDPFVRNVIHGAPHVVVGEKLHVSFGGQSFTFDTANDRWEESKLFGTFWEKNSPSNFNGGKLWCYKERKGFGGPLGFYGKGIIWENDILLGVHHSPFCPLIAYRLEDGIVVECQPFTLEQLGMEGDYLIRECASLLDLGRDNCFGIVHFLQEDAGYGSDVRMELLTFKVSRPKPKPTAANGCFLKCAFVRKDIVAEELLPSANTHYYAFVV